MMRKITSFFLFAITLIAISCQANGEFKIKGDGCNPGDTIHLTADMRSSTPKYTCVADEKGNFEFTDSVSEPFYCKVYKASDENTFATLFVESGNISVSLNADQSLVKVGGTKLNDEWQTVNDTMAVYEKRIQAIASTIESQGPEGQKAAMGKISEHIKAFGEWVLSKAEANINNYMGYFLLTYFNEYFDTNKQDELLAKLPEQYKAKPEVKRLIESHEAMAKYAEGKTIGDFKQPGLDGKEVSILSIAKENKITVLDFWASWCGPCRQEMPMMKEMYAELKGKGLQIIGISLDNKHDAWAEAVKQLELPWPQMSDLGGWQNAIAQEFAVNSIPHTVVIDSNGKILKRGLRGQELKDFVAEQLSK